MYFPQKIRVAGFDYTVATKDEIIKVPFKDIGYNKKGFADALGYNNYQKQEIVICTDAPEDRQKEVLLHEVLHSVINHFAIPMPEDIEEMENVVTGLSEGLYQVFNDNPEFIKVYLDQPKTGSLRGEE